MNPQKPFPSPSSPAAVPSASPAVVSSASAEVHPSVSSAAVPSSSPSSSAAVPSVSPAVVPSSPSSSSAAVPSASAEVHPPLLSVINGVPRHPAFRMAAPVSLEILSGEQIAIIGPNASGKTRLVEILTGRWPLLNGNEVHYHFPGAPSQRAYDHIKVITFRDSYGDSDHSYYLQQRWNQHDIDASTPMVDGKYIISLSSGELRKYQLYKALQSHPRLLVIDNPFIGLDPQARQQLQQTLHDLIHQQDLQLLLLVSREKDIPDFITHLIRVTPGCQVSPKQPYHTPSSSPSSSCSSSYPSAAVLSPSSPSAAVPSAFAEVPPPFLRFNHVSIRYGSHTLLNDISWTVRQGEHWALSGPNGSGKSTLLSLICADNPQAYACDIELFGRRRGTGESIWDIKRHIGYVSPEMHRAYLRDLPAIDIVASGLHDSVGLYTRPRPEQRQTCLAWMERFGIASLADRTFMRLSSGEQRLCLLARAFVKSPDLLILDEPFHGLDDERRLLATRIIEDYCADPAVTLIVVSHYADELPACIDHHFTLTAPEDPRAHRQSSLTADADGA